MERPLDQYVVYQEVQVKHQIWAAVFISSTECVEETEFGKLIRSLSNGDWEPTLIRIRQLKIRIK